MLVQKTLGELQSELPIGVLNSNGRLLRNFKFKEWLWEQEEQVAEAKEAGTSLADFVVEVLWIMIEELGDWQLGKMKKDEFRVKIYNTYLADVFYLYVYLRYESMGPDIPMKLKCRYCTKEFDWVGDMESLDIMSYRLPEPKNLKLVNPEDSKVPEEVDEKELKKQEIEMLLNPMELTRGIGYNDKFFTELSLQPCKWKVMDAIGADEFNEANMKKVMLQNSIANVKGIEMPGVFYLADKLLKTINKRDLEFLIATSTKVNAGPEMSVEAKHKKCGNTNRFAVDWTYDNFFALSPA